MQRHAAAILPPHYTHTNIIAANMAFTSSMPNTPRHDQVSNRYERYHTPPPLRFHYATLLIHTLFTPDAHHVPWWRRADYGHGLVADIFQ